MKKENFDELLESVKEGCAILKGEKKPSRVIDFGEPDVKAIRKTLGLTQVQFAAMLGISVATLRNWEQGRRTPEGPAMVLLRVAEKNPEAILDVTQVA